MGQNDKYHYCKPVDSYFQDVARMFYEQAEKHHSDQLAEIRLRQAFPDRELIAIDSIVIAKLGGVLNCATWNIKA